MSLKKKKKKKKSGKSTGFFFLAFGVSMCGDNILPWEDLRLEKVPCAQRVPRNFFFLVEFAGFRITPYTKAKNNVGCVGGSVSRTEPTGMQKNDGDKRPSSSSGSKAAPSMAKGDQAGATG